MPILSLVMMVPLVICRAANRPLPNRDRSILYILWVLSKQSSQKILHLSATPLFHIYFFCGRLLTKLVAISNHSASSLPDAPPSTRSQPFIGLPVISNG